MVRGTNAEIWLPRAAKQDPQRDNRTAAPSIEPVGPLQVMVVDDHPGVRSTTTAMLQELGHQVAEAHAGDEALAMMKAGQQCDLLITDYAMPNMSGVELVREARRRNPSLPAMIITGYADNDALAEHLDAVNVLPKPFTIERLSEAVAVATNRKHGAGRVVAEKAS